MKNPIPNSEEPNNIELGKKETSTQTPSLYSRRDFFTKVGWQAFLAGIGVSVLSIVKFFFPRVLYETPQIFLAGFPQEYGLGVSTRWVKEHRVWIIRDEKGFYGLFARCTHLGCTAIWMESENKFKCPCHGSGFKMNGINYEGPAPRALERVKITLADDGSILVDKGVLFAYEKGEWEKPDAFLQYENV